MQVARKVELVVHLIDGYAVRKVEQRVAAGSTELELFENDRELAGESVLWV